MELLGTGERVIIGTGSVELPLVVTDGFVLVGDVVLSGASIVDSFTHDQNTIEYDMSNSNLVDDDNSQITNGNNSVTLCDTDNEVEI